MSTQHPEDGFRQKLPWEEVEDDGHPWELRGYWIEHNGGWLRQAVNVFSKDTRFPVGYERPSQWPLMEAITYDELLKIVNICKDKDLTWADAAKEFYGEENFPPSWLVKANANPCRYAGVSEENRWYNRKDEPELVSVASDENTAPPTRKVKRVKRTSEE